MFSRLTFDIFISRYCQAHQHEALAKGSSNLPLTSYFNYGEARTSSWTLTPLSRYLHCGGPGPAVHT
eukprot:3893051-Prymnesium_polylepis.1